MISRSVGPLLGLFGLLAACGGGDEAAQPGASAGSSGAGAGAQAGAGLGGVGGGPGAGQAGAAGDAASGAGGEGGAGAGPQVAFLSPEGAPITSIRWGERFVVKAQGLTAGESVELLASAYDFASTTVAQASASFVVASDGTVDLSRDAPSGGSYQGVDPDGLVWSMEPGKKKTSASDSPLLVELRRGATTVGQAQLDRVYLDPAVKIRQVTEQGLEATLYVPPGPPRPVVMVMGGSEGGIVSAQRGAALLATYGYAALALAYFAEGSLPPTLTQIPVEYFGKALDFLAHEPDVDGSRVVVRGGSRGGELVLLLGERFGQLKGVIADVPSGVSWGAPVSLVDEVASWTAGGQDLPFVPSSGEPTFSKDADGKTLWHYTPSFLDALAKAPAEQKDAAAFRVEKLAAPYLLVGGADDQVWPSCMLSDIAWKRLEDAGHVAKHQDEHVCYPEAGHWIFFPGSPTTHLDGSDSGGGVRLAIGGTPAGVGRAQRDLHGRVLAFLERTLD